MPGCSIRALWIINNHGNVVFSRRFPVVERQWRLSCQREYDKVYKDSPLASTRSLPGDEEVASSFFNRRQSEGSSRGSGIRLPSSSRGSDSWIDDPITRHIISLCIKKEEEGSSSLLWPLVLHCRGIYCILVLPLVDPCHLKEYEDMLHRSECGSSNRMGKGVSSILLDSPSITGAFSVAHALGDVLIGDSQEPEILSPSPTVGGLLDSLTGGIGISAIGARSKSVSALPFYASPSGGASAASGATFDASSAKPLDRDVLRNFISTSMPFGTPLYLNFSNIMAIKANGFQSSDVPPVDRKQPAWKPYLFKGKQRITFSILETVYAAMYDRDEIPDTLSISGQVNCRAELEGLPDVSFPLAGFSTSQIEILSFHPCAQIPEHGMDKQSLMFSPPLGNFLLMCYQAQCSLGPPVKGFYQLSMVSENEGAFLFKLSLMEGYKSPLAMEFCTITMPFPRRKIVSFDGNPSLGTVSSTEHAVEWKVISSGRSAPGKSIEATFPGTIKFSPISTIKSPGPLSFGKGCMDDDDSFLETENLNNVVDVEEFLMQKMNRDLPPVDMDEPFCWDAYDYAKVAFKIGGGTLSGMTIDPKRINIYPSVKAPVEFAAQVTSGDYILWNTLGKCPHAASPKV